MEMKDFHWDEGQTQHFKNNIPKSGKHIVSGKMYVGEIHILNLGYFFSNHVSESPLHTPSPPKGSKATQKECFKIRTDGVVRRSRCLVRKKSSAPLARVVGKMTITGARQDDRRDKTRSFCSCSSHRRWWQLGGTCIPPGKKRANG